MTDPVTDAFPQLVSDRDVEDALQAVTEMLVRPASVMSLPPQLAVNLPNIRRCLLELKTQRDLKVKVSL